MDTSSISSAFHSAVAALGTGGITLFFVALAVWSLAWKGVALWFSARNHQKKWFIVMLIVNTAGILPIIYLLAFRRDKQEGRTKSLFNNPLPSPEEQKDAAPVAESRQA